jgi:hypothetical protein
VVNPALIQILLGLWIFVLWIGLFAVRLYHQDCNAAFEDDKEAYAVCGFFLLLALGFAGKYIIKKLVP